MPPEKPTTKHTCTPIHGQQGIQRERPVDGQLAHLEHVKQLEHPRAHPACLGRELLRQERQVEPHAVVGVQQVGLVEHLEEVLVLLGAVPAKQERLPELSGPPSAVHAHARHNVLLGVHPCGLYVEGQHRFLARCLGDIQHIHITSTLPNHLTTQSAAHTRAAEHTPSETPRRPSPSCSRC